MTAFLLVGKTICQAVIWRAAAGRMPLVVKQSEINALKMQCQ